MYMKLKKYKVGPEGHYLKQETITDTTGFIKANLFIKSKPCIIAAGCIMAKDLPCVRNSRPVCVQHCCLQTEA